MILLFSILNTHAAFSQDDKDIAATVNGQKITITEINRAVQVLPQYQKLQLEMLEDMIVKTLIYQESVKAGTKVERSEVDSGFKEYIKKLNLSAEIVKKEMKRMNLTEETMKTEIMKQLMVERFLKKRSKSLNLSVSDEEVKSFYNENPDTFKKPERVHIRHILIKCDHNEKQKADAAKKKIYEIKEKLKKKEGSFAELAKKFSEDKSSSEAGGDLKSEITRNSPLPKAFIDEAFSLTKDQVSDVVKSNMGFHLMQLVEKKPVEKTQFNEIKESLKFRLLEQKNNIEMKKYVDALVDKSDIKIKLDKRDSK
ncbi:MAG: peptidylprolyl isomerase [Desulfobacteraceae bacterium]